MTLPSSASGAAEGVLVPQRPVFAGSSGWSGRQPGSGSSFSSAQSTPALSGGSRYRPTMSVSYSRRTVDRGTVRSFRPGEAADHGHPGCVARLPGWLPGLPPCSDHSSGGPPAAWLGASGGGSARASSPTSAACDRGPAGSPSVPRCLLARGARSTAAQWSAGRCRAAGRSGSWKGPGQPGGRRFATEERCSRRPPRHRGHAVGFGRGRPGRLGPTWRQYAWSLGGIGRFLRRYANGGGSSRIRARFHRAAGRGRPGSVPARAVSGSSPSGPVPRRAPT